MYAEGKPIWTLSCLPAPSVLVLGAPGFCCTVVWSCWIFVIRPCAAAITVASYTREAKKHHRISRCCFNPIQFSNLLLSACFGKQKWTVWSAVCHFSLVLWQVTAVVELFSMQGGRQSNTKKIFKQEHISLAFFHINHQIMDLSCLLSLVVTDTAAAAIMCTSTAFYILIKSSMTLTPWGVNKSIRFNIFIRQNIRC